MSHTSDFVAELFRAANELDRLSMVERGRLLQRAYATIKDLRAEVAIKTGANLSDAADRIRITGSTISRRSDAEVKSALLVAAEMIRSLKMLIEAKNEILSP